MAPTLNIKKAIPLVLPNNCTWNEETGEYTTIPDVERKTLDLNKKALDQLREIKGKVCVVSIAGPCRQGKSYILSKVFDQGQVFPLGHKLIPETMGIWMWVVPKKYRDSYGREFTVVLLDSEGIDAPYSDGCNDHSIFTLSVLLSSVMIYNSVGAPKRNDLENLDFIVNLSKRIQLGANQTDSAHHFYEAFPYFIWLLRDVNLDLPEGCSNTKDYFIKHVLSRKQLENNESAREAAESIFRFFCGFDAFSLPIPAFGEVIKNLDDESLKSKGNPRFIEQVEAFKSFLYAKLIPKRAINHGEFVTGEALAALAQLFVEALNAPETVPNVKVAWDTYVQNKCKEEFNATLAVYEEEMMSWDKKIPCDADEIRAGDTQLIRKCLDIFKEKTSSLSIKSVENYWKELLEATDDTRFNWLKRNKEESEKYCNQLIKDLKKDILNPVLIHTRMQSPEAKIRCAELAAAYTKIEQEYTSRARGDKEVQATVLLDTTLNFRKDMEQDITKLEENHKLEQEQILQLAASVEEKSEKRIAKMLVAIMEEKRKEEELTHRQMNEQTLKDQSDQANNAKEANYDKLEKEKEVVIKENEKLKERLNHSITIPIPAWLRKKTKATKKKKPKKPEKITLLG